MAERAHHQNQCYNSALLIRATLILNGILFLLLLGQFLYYLPTSNIMLVEYPFLLFILGTIGILSIIGGLMHDYLFMNPVNGILCLIGFGLFGYLSIFFNGPWDKLLFLIGLSMMIINLLSILFNFRLILMKKTRTQFLKRINWKNNKPMKIILFIALLLIIPALGTTSYYSFWKTITIQAPEEFTTISSYWGPPSLKLNSHTTEITPINTNRIEVNNESMVNDPDDFVLGSFAYVSEINIGQDSQNVINYSAGDKSYSNGSILLATPLSSIENVSITFKYVENWEVLRDLSIGQSTLIMNFHGDFIYDANIFNSIEQVYLLQLLDFWHIKYYLDIYNLIEFPHIFNYKNSIPIGYQTLDWAKQWKYFQGISFDFESGSNAIPEGNPGGNELFPGSLIPNTEEWQAFKDSWYHLNEQNQTLIQESWQAYEDLYDYGTDLGYRTYIVFGGGEMRDMIDGDQDFTRLPTIYKSPNQDVLYGIMCYQDNNFDSGRFNIYRDCRTQLELYGEQGDSILLGWIANGTKYYTDDEIGLQRYIQDCKIAQASGMKEIFHAPLYRMQSKWGDDAILQLHQALNEEPKEKISLEIPKYHYNVDFINDFVENFNEPLMFTLILIIFILDFSILGPFSFKQTKKR